MRRKRIAVAIYDGLLGYEYGIVAEMFGLVRPGLEKIWYDYMPCRVEKGTITSSHGLIMAPRFGTRELLAADTIVIPGWRSPAHIPRPSFVKAIRTAYQNGSTLISICSGAFVLGHAGLLDGRRSTAHWLHTDELQRSFPKTTVMRDRLYVNDGRISTSAGSSAGLDLCLSVIRDDFGVEIANLVARRMVAPSHREGGQSQYVQPAVLAIENDEMGPVLDWMTKHIAEPITLEMIADRFSMSLRTFQRRFQALTGLAPLNWLNENRLTRARALLETTDFSIEQVAHRSGLGSTANLRKHFERRLKTTPSVYRSTFKLNPTKPEKCET
jgi:AraC family transcriptional regulator, transcriptional activator FtrA